MNFKTMTIFASIAWVQPLAAAAAAQASSLAVSPTESNATYLLAAAVLMGLWWIAPSSGRSRSTEVPQRQRPAMVGRTKAPTCTSLVAARFLERQLSFTKPLNRQSGEACEMTFADNPVPGIGKHGQRMLEEHGISNAAQVVGWYLRLNGDDKAMSDFLVRCGCHEPSVQRDNGTVAMLREKSAAFVLPRRHASPVRPSAAAAGKTTLVMANFLSKQLSWEDDFNSLPVPGLGVDGRNRLRSCKFCIENAVQLVGHYMVLNGDDDQFVDFLVSDCGLQRQFVTNQNGILQGIKAKLEPFCSA